MKGMDVECAPMQKPCGFYMIDKPTDWTSFDVCARVRKHLDMKKVGHTGTLDPFATGLLVVAVGKATKLIPYINKAQKEYEATFFFGAKTATLDPESAPEPQADAPVPTLEQIENVLPHFQGVFQQVPPQFSAIKIKGQRAYKLARRGEKADLPPRPVVVEKLQIIEYKYPELRVRVRAHAGFYVRSLARDVAEKLGTVGYCTQLRRTAVGELCVEDAEPLDCLTTPVDPRYIVNELPHREIVTDRLRDFWEGRAFPYDGIDGEKYLVIHNGKTVGVGEVTCGKLQPRVSFTPA